MATLAFKRAEQGCEERIFGTAEVLEVDAATQGVRVRLETSEDESIVWAQLAVAVSDLEIREGDRVLVIGDNAREVFIIGFLGKATLAPNPIAELRLNGGTRACAVPESHVMRVFSSRDELLFEYDEIARRARVNVPCGDLEFAAANGSIRFEAARDVVIQGRSVNLHAPSARDSQGAPQVQGIELRDSGVRISAQRGDLTFEQANFAGKRLLAKYEEGKLVIDRLETISQVLTEKAKNVCRSVEELAQLSAGRIRTLVRATYFFKAARAYVRSEADYKIKAEKIHLG